MLARGVTIMLISAGAANMRAALSLALAATALGQRARIYCHEDAVALLAHAPRDDDDAARLAMAGLPDRLAMLAMAAESRAELWACQTGMAMSGLTLAELVASAQAGGLMALLATLADDRLVTL